MKDIFFWYGMLVFCLIIVVRVTGMAHNWSNQETNTAIGQILFNIQLFGTATLIIGNGVFRIIEKWDD